MAKEGAMTTHDRAPAHPTPAHDGAQPPAPQPPGSAAPVASLSRSARPPAVDPTRPFGAHVRMSWWKPLIILPALIILMLVIQIMVASAVMIIEYVATGEEPGMAMSPWMTLATNLSIALMAPIAVVLMRFLGKVPVREQFRIGRPTSWSRLGIYLVAFSLMIIVVNAVMIALDPSSLSAIGLSGGIILLIVVVLLTTRPQAAAEEVMFRGAILPAISSWIRPAKAAIVVGLIASSVVFGLMHGSVDPWLLSYYTIFGVSMALMAVISRGLEAPIAFHVANNVLLLLIGALGSDDGFIVIDRSVGMGGPFMLIFVGLDLVAVGFVWLMERRLRKVERSADVVAAPERPTGVAQPTV